MTIKQLEILIELVEREKTNSLYQFEIKEYGELLIELKEIKDDMLSCAISDSKGIWGYKSVEHESKRKCKKEALERIATRFEQEKKKENINLEALAGLMTEMERTFNIPSINNEAYNKNNKEIIALYRDISNSRGLFRKKLKVRGEKGMEI